MAKYTNIFDNAKWIKSNLDGDMHTELYAKSIRFENGKTPVKAVLHISARGVYEAFLNGKRIGDFILAPGWTAYRSRLQYQSYELDVNELLSPSLLTVSVASGWYSGYIAREKRDFPIALIAVLEIEFSDGTSETIVTDESWEVSEGAFAVSDLYHGEHYDANFVHSFGPVHILDFTKDTLIPQQGEIICEHERLLPVCEIITPKGERVIDFGQNITGYVEMAFDGKKGEEIIIDHAEVLDIDGNFYRDNLRRAKAKIEYICKDGFQTYKPHHSFMGFRYIRLTNCPEHISYKCFNAIVVHSGLKRTGFFKCSDPKINKLYSNIVWGHRDNFLDVPTDCPQRDERLGWTGDAQVFIKTATYNYDVEKFFTKWLYDLAEEQYPDGSLPYTIPNVFEDKCFWSEGKVKHGSAWADAIVICPWQLYVSYNNTDILRKMYPYMEKYIAFLKAQGDDPYTWPNGDAFGDWLAMEDTDKQFISDAFYYYSLSLVIKAGKVLGKDTGDYEALLENVKLAFKKNHPQYNSQTECVLALHFGICNDKKETASLLAQKIKDNGNRLSTGFVGTPYLAHVLSDNGYTDLAYTLLLQEKFPSWLFSVNMGATTVWEHWDSMREDGTMWDTGMNSFNHYAYGCIADWMYGVMCGIKPCEDAPGYREFTFEPKPDKRFNFAEMEYETRSGKIRAGWKRTEKGYEYHLTVPQGTKARVCIAGEKSVVEAGEYVF